ncbi:unnamed protein product [Adineta ricciae]|uniref:Uncharacterized protein n=1 Tax=Adineta ricciae TaxID=249248 RepID=A0A814ANC4_ADIRI|nr:unnamed protein product [Adineta ricciae]
MCTFPVCRYIVYLIQKIFIRLTSPSAYAFDSEGVSALSERMSSCLPFTTMSTMCFDHLTNATAALQRLFDPMKAHSIDTSLMEVDAY